MDAVLARCLASPTVRSFVFKRTPEGKLSEAALLSSITYSYSGSPSASFIKPPKFKETIVPHHCVDGFALCETLGLEQKHPILPLLKTVSNYRTLSAEVLSRRTVISLNAENVLDTLEFSWMSDGRLLVSYRCTNLGECWTWMHSLETRLYAPIQSPYEFPGEVELRFEISDLYPSMCNLCQWKQLPSCECAPPISLRRSASRPTKAVVPGTWHNYNLLFHQLNRVGNVEVRYFETRRGSVERLLHKGNIWYHLTILPSFGDLATRKQQLHVYKVASGSLISSPQVDASLQYGDYLVPSSSESANQDTSYGSESSGWIENDNYSPTLDITRKSRKGKLVVIDDPAFEDCAINDDDDGSTIAPAKEEEYIPSPSSSSGVLSDGDSFACGRCGMSFLERGTCLRHIADIHGPERFHTCIKCSSQFDTVSELRRHEINHHHQPGKPRCDACGKKFRLHQSLELHIRTVHNQEKPFQCKLCPMNFARKSALTRHTRSVHMAQKYVCLEPGCHAQYAQPFDLKKHMMRKGHGDVSFSLSKGKASYTDNLIQVGNPNLRSIPSPEVT